MAPATGDASPVSSSSSDFIELFVPGRICLFGEHSDWSGGYRRFNSDVREGCALVCGTTQGLYARAKRRATDDRTVSFRGPDGVACELAVDDTAELRTVAQSASYHAYIAGTLLELGKHFRFGGAEIDNYKADLPIKKGLSSSAAICVLVVRALNELFDLKLTVHGEMDIAYRGEINTPSRCGRLDQCVAFGQRVTRMTFDNDLIDTEPVRVAATVYLVIVDLRAAKDTKEILKCLNAAYPFPRDDKDRALHSLLGEINLGVCSEAVKVLSQERDPRRAAERLGALMTAAQKRWDTHAVPLCPHELKAPALHRLLECEPLQKHIAGGKGVGSQGDGSAQLVCLSEADQAAAMEIVRGLGMDPLLLTISAQKAVRCAVVPIAGTCSGMWPATKCIGPWLFPVRVGNMVKPAICWLCEELVAAEVETIVLVVNAATQAQMEHLFKRREDVSILDGVAAEAAAYDQVLLDIGKRLVFVRQDHPSGIRDALLLCERVVGNEPFLLAWGDHLCSSTDENGVSCIAQLLGKFQNQGSVIAVHGVAKEWLHTAGIFCSKVSPSANPSKPFPLSRCVEKPTVAYAEEHLRTPGVEDDKFLASFGQYVLTPGIFKKLRSNPKIHFTAALDALRQEEGLNAVLMKGVRWDLGSTSTYIQALQAQAGPEPASATKKRKVTQ